MRKQRQRRDIKQERTSDEEVHREDTFVIFRYINSSDSNPKAKSTLNNSTDSLGKKQDVKEVCERNNLDVKKGNEICKENKVENCKKDEVENCEKDEIENCKNNLLEVSKENELNDETESEAAISKENVDVDVLNKIRNICPFCEKEFSSELNVERHVISVHQKRFKCSVCTKSYSSRTKLGLHETVHKPDLFFECSICHVKYRSENTLQRHQVRVHEKDNIIYVCEHCGKNYKLKSDLSIHIKKTHPFELQICRYCGKEVKDITGHEYSHIRRARKKPCNFTCHLCPQKFCHRSRLDKHLSKHKNGFKCTYCELKFQGSKELKNHKHLKHSQSGSLICIFCQKVFACSSNFYQHVLTHAGIRPYKCDICEEDFTQRSSLLRHRRNHPGPLPQLAVQSPQVADLARSYIQKFQNGLIDKPSH